MLTKTMDTPIGPISIVAKGQYITSLSFGKADATKNDGTDVEAELLDRAESQLHEYFAGTRRDFDLLLELTGTDFQRAVWTRCAQIPCGQTITYGQLAADIGRPKAARAVGMAMHDNPIVLIVPCHRVVGATGSLTGFAGGLDTKRWLLDNEQSHS